MSTSLKKQSVKRKSSSKIAKQEFDLLALPDVIITQTPKSKSTPLCFIESEQFPDWIQKQSISIQNQCETQKFTCKPGQIALTQNNEGKIDSVLIGYSGKVTLYTVCPALDKIPKGVFHIGTPGLKQHEIDNIVTGWLLSCYRFTAFKTGSTDFPILAIPKTINDTRAKSLAQAIYLVRNLINLPPNALGPQALAEAAVMVATLFKAKSRVIVDTDLITENFPLIFGVGDGSERRPRLVDFTWGHTKNPKVTLVGKGVCFDTGGYDLKPSTAMALQKKDMGGAAMALGVAYMIMALDLPVRLRVLIPAVENSVSGRSYRPSDILHSRKGLTVEINNTDAEGRLILADCLTLASEESPDLLIDFSTLTGAGRVATGYEIAPIYSNNDDLAHRLQTLSLQINDPLWHMPLWENYRSDILSPNADLSNSGNNPAGSITAALFLQSFVGNGIDWIHLDHYAWEMTGKPGRPKGGADTGMRAVLSLIEEKYSHL
ncbi:MAG: leucyl aminopeptidase family protein [Alphaproteobacteria bacterium]|nr:leucyl aminopeptidase family protein [Alphaproteobacteria bacterium]